MRIFAEDKLRVAIENQLREMHREIISEPKNKLLNMNEVKYVDYLLQKYTIEPLMLLWKDEYVTNQEVEVPAEKFPLDFNVYSGKSYLKQVITYHIPFVGERDLFKYRPSRLIQRFPEVNIDVDCVSFDVINWNNDVEQIKREADGIKSVIRRQHENVSREVEVFNKNLKLKVEEAVKSRKSEILRQSDFLSSLGVPIKKSSKTPETFSVPSVKKKILVKPTAPNTAFKPEPTLDTELYTDILQLCHDFGGEMENKPSIYEGKNEEALRDHFIMMLSPHFDSVTGETFNKVGKTDILIRHESSNLFVGECKFWHGAKGFKSTIDQALSYLTWRDSKVAILQFIKNKRLTRVLEQIEPTAEEHPCYVSTEPANEEGWYNFNFHLLGDPSRGVKLAVLCFHFPPD